MFKEIFQPYNYNEVQGLTDELKAIYITNYHNISKETIVFVTSTLYEANKFFQLISNYTDNVMIFPMDDFLTSEALAMSPELLTIRLETIDNLINNKNKIIITNLMGYLRFLPKIELFKKNSIVLKVGQSLKIEDLMEKLFKIGYRREVNVTKTGEIAVRGYVLDVFPLNDDSAIRIEYWGDVIENIKTFNIDTQRSLKSKNEVSIFPNTEFITEKNVPFEKIKQKNLYLYEDVVNISNLYKSTIFFNDYSNLCISYENLLNEIWEYNQSSKVSEIYMNDFYNIKNNKEIIFQNFDNKAKKDIKKFNAKELIDFNFNEEDLNKKLTGLMKKYTVIVAFSNKDKVRRFERLINNTVITDFDNLFKTKINIIEKKIKKGFILDDYIVISEEDLYNKQSLEYKYKTNFKIGTKINDIDKLIVGDYIVHTAYGIGKYVGLKVLEKNGLKKDYIEIKYANDDKLYIPVEKIEYIHKYSSKDGSVPKLNRLNSSEWSKTKAKVRKKIEDIAEDLIKLYAAREEIIGYSFEKDSQDQFDFENDFIYEETLDQIKVIKEIKKDMESIHPMDRLLCGDVGYGKTEVAFRAIFKAVLSNKQVALLCPTTILSSQHYKNALERFKNYPINIALLNRFVSTKDINEIKKKLKTGKIDLLIGTHRILSDDIIFRDLGFLVIDEEQRFGVKHKEKIKQFKNSIDVLTLSATPIPRTLQMSMTGIRSLSLIETPPINRYPIQTYVLIENNQIIKDAIYKELSREGQVFILYNKIETMNKKEKELKGLIPDAKIVSVHGQLSKNELENIMQKFINKEYDVLLCTTIIETGIDIPSVNTLIIYDADHFGLSQLYQIRGRVGRSNKIAYAYLMYNRDKILNETAVKRLNAIKEFTELGSGFKIAMRDLSIRGAGDILGSEQAGFVDSVGIELFLEMLDEELKRQKGEKILPEDTDSQPFIEVATSIDNKIIFDEELKIEIHKKINTINSFEKLNEIRNELKDRFGIVTEEIEIYMHQELFEAMAKELGIKNIRQTDREILIIINEELFKKLKVTDLFINTTNINRNFKFKMMGKNLMITLNLLNLEKHFIYYLIEFLNLIKQSK